MIPMEYFHFFYAFILFLSLLAVDIQAVTFDEGEALAREFDIPFFETSAMTDVNVNDAFMSIAKAVKDRLENQEKEGDGGGAGSGGEGKKKGKKGKKGKGEKLDGKNATRSKKGCC